jgi:hypothetical protein
VVATAHAVAADQVLVLALEVVRAERLPLEDPIAHPRRIAFQLLEHTLGVRLLRLLPASRLYPIARIALDPRGQHPHLHPQHLPSLWGPGRIDGGGLADDEQGAGRQVAVERLRVGCGHLLHVRPDVDVAELAQIVVARPRDRPVERRVDHHRAWAVDV